VVLALPLAACSGVEGVGGVDRGFNLDCSIPASEIVDPPVPRDGIPALDFPELLAVHEATHLAPEDRVLGLVANGVARAYPLRMLWWHEVVNDTVADDAVLITYCPLTGSGIAFQRAPTGDPFRFGVSGLVLNNGPLAVLDDEVAGRPIIVFFEPGSQTAVAYEREVDGQILTFERSTSGEIVDGQTGSAWNLLGEATAGPLEGAALARLPRAYVAYWFAWAAFNPGTRIWTP
jgi:hypothetical protein